MTKTPEEVEELGKQLSQHIIGFKPKTIEAKPGMDGLTDDGMSTSLLQQSFIFDEDLTVSQVLDECNVKVMDFVRFECGVND